MLPACWAAAALAASGAGAAEPASLAAAWEPGSASAARHEAHEAAAREPGSASAARLETHEAAAREPGSAPAARLEAHEVAAREPGSAPAARLEARESVVADQSRAALRSARTRALSLYRLTRGSHLRDVSDPAGRIERARALDAGLRAMARDLGEGRALGAESDRLRAERERLPGSTEAGPPSPPPALAGPVAGPIVARFGPAKDPVTGAALRRAGVQFLARGGEPVRAVAAGTVYAVDRAPAGGSVVVISHAGRWTSITTGLRDVVVAPGDRVAARQVLGAAGRNVDGAPIVGLALSRGRAFVDPSPLLRR